jgi:YD repeat-containing protein
VKSILLMLTLFTIPCVAQKPSTSPPGVATKGDCSPAVTGNNNNFKFTCGVGEEQGKQIIALLNRMLAKDNTSVVIEKLNELLKRTNPNGTITTYDCDGGKRTQTLSTGSTVADVPAPGELIQPMLNLYNAHQMTALLTECQTQIASKPEWLTPRLFCGLGYVGLHDIANAKQMLDYYDANVGPAYDAPFCQEASTWLHTKIK